MRLWFFLPILLLSLVLNSCVLLLIDKHIKARRETEREARTAPEYKLGNGRVTSLEFYSRNWATLNPQGLARINDQTFVLAFQSSPDSAMVRCYDDTLGVVWQTLFQNRDERTFQTFSQNGQIFIFSYYVGSYWDTLAYIGRSFNTITGAFLRADTLFAGKSDIYNYTKMLYPADNSALPMLVCAKPSVEQGDYIVRNYTFYKIQPDFSTTTRTIDITIPPIESASKFPTFVLTSTGDVLYTSCQMSDSALYLSIIRVPIPSGRPDTLRVSAPRYTAEKDELQPDDVILSESSDGSIYVAWNIENDKEAAFIRLIHCDFRSQKVSVFADIPFTEEKNKTLFKESSFQEPHLLACRPLADGRLFVLFADCEEIKNSAYSKSGGYSYTSYATDWLGAVCLNSDGSTRWIKSIPREKYADRAELLYSSSIYQQDSILYSVVFDNDFYLRNITFSLSDGAFTNTPFPLYTRIIFPNTLLWNTDGTAITLFNIDDDQAYIGRLYPREIKVLPSEPQVE